jgi:hypothetical protein
LRVDAACWKFGKPDADIKSMCIVRKRNVASKPDFIFPSPSNSCQKDDCGLLCIWRKSNPAGGAQTTENEMKRLASGESQTERSERIEIFLL